MRLICELCEERRLSAVINIHDVQLAQMFAQRIVGLRLGEIGTYDGAPDADAGGPYRNLRRRRLVADDPEGRSEENDEEDETRRTDFMTDISTRRTWRQPPFIKNPTLRWTLSWERRLSHRGDRHDRSELDARVRGLAARTASSLDSSRRISLPAGTRSSMAFSRVLDDGHRHRRDHYLRADRTGAARNIAPLPVYYFCRRHRDLAQLSKSFWRFSRQAGFGPFAASSP